jgi:hypothetical protein
MKDHKDVARTAPSAQAAQPRKDSAYGAGEAPAPGAHDEAPGDEFRLIIKKLDMPVRPRGVLAE